MNVMRLVCATVVATGFALAPSSARAQDTQPPAPPPAAQPPESAPPPTAQPPESAPPTTGSAVTSSKIFNPDMAIIGDFLGAAGRNTVNPSPALEMHESELSLQANVDPYMRADFFISFGEQGVGLEEGFVTVTEAPLGLLTRVGKMRAAFGKVNTLHNHVLPWTDRPLVTQNLVGGEDGIDDAGISVARLITNPWIFLEATGQVFRGDSGDLYKSSTRGDLSYVGHLRGYQDITEDSNIDLGVSYSRGHNDSAGSIPDVSAETLSAFTTQLFGVDATFRWRPLQRSIYHSFVGRAEWIRSRREQPSGLQSGSGFYVSGDYQAGRRWFTGVRLDRSARAADASLTDSGASFTVTYWPSEFSQLRAQYRRTNYETAPSIVSTANELLFQFQFSIGAHGAHVF